MKKDKSRPGTDIFPVREQSPLKRLAQNTLFNFSGQAVILIIAVIAIPVLIRGMGTERFGVLALVWSFVGYFSLFDLGLGRALTTLVARNMAKNPDDVPPLIWTGLSILILLGCAGSVAMFYSAPLVVQGFLKMPDELKSESMVALYLIVAVFPLVITSAGFRGVLEGLQRFDIVNVVNVSYGIVSFAGTLLVLKFSTHLGLLAAVPIIGRCLSWTVMLLFCLRLIPGLRQWNAPVPGDARKLLAFGGWMTVTNMVGPLMVTLDRFLIGAWISVAAVAYYTTPYDAVTRLWIIPAALVSALFPLFSALQVSNQKDSTRFFSIGIKSIFITLFPLTLLIVAFAQEGLAIWLDDTFAAQSTQVLQWLAVGVFINSLAHVPFALIQAAGRPDLTAKLHLLELPFYLLCVLVMIQHFGIKGAAVAWTIRVAVDAAVLFFMAWRLFFRNQGINRAMIITVIAALLIIPLSSFMDNIIARIVLCLFTIPMLTLGSYRYVLSSNERGYLLSAYRTIRGGSGGHHA